MAGHSQFKNIMHRKGAQDKKRAKFFNKLAREITVAAKSGQPDPEQNARLRNAIAAARAGNMPNSRIKTAIDMANPSSGDAAQYEEVRYEGYGPGGVAVIIEGLTDNRNRTAPEIRSAFSKNGGVMGESNSVSFMFQRIGQIIYPATVCSADAMFEAAVEAGAENVDSTADIHEVMTKVEDFTAVRESLEQKFGTPDSSAIVWKPQNMIALEGEQAQTMIDLIETLEENDDVQNVFSNADIADSVFESMMVS